MATHSDLAFQNQASSRAILRVAMIKWASSAQFSHAITLNINQRDASLLRAKRLLSDLFLDLDRFVIGRRRVLNVPSRQRFNAIAFPEHVETNLHFHLAADLRPDYLKGLSEQIVCAKIKGIWTEVTQGSGTALITPARDWGWARYMTKEMYRPEHEYFLAADFHPA